MLAVFRADADLAQGGGHVARCSALARELRRRGCRTALAGRSGSLATVPFVAGAFDEMQPLERGEVDELSVRWPDGCDVAVVDHYGYDARFESSLRPWAHRILAIDDLVDRPHDCDLLLDASLSRASDDYAALVPGHARLLIGPEFALLRPDFSAARSARSPRHFADARLRVLVMFGATDHGGQTELAVAALANSDLPIEIDVVVGPLARSLPALERLAAGARVPVALAVGATDIARRMSAADIGIGGAGTTSWERCCVGLPAMVIVLADNQVHIARGLGAHGAALVLGAMPNVTGACIVDTVRGLIECPDRLRRMSASAAALCDGRGAERVADQIIKELH